MKSDHNLELISNLVNSDRLTDKFKAFWLFRELVNSTIGFEILAEQLNKPSKSLHRMLSAKGNPTMDNLTNIFVALQNDLDFDVEIKLSSHNKRSTRYAQKARVL